MRSTCFFIEFTVMGKHINHLHIEITTGLCGEKNEYTKAAGFDTIYS